MHNQKLLRKLLGLLLAVGTLAGSALPVSASQVTFTTLIEAQYEDAGQFNEGLAAVKKDGKWGYIDETGEMVIPFQYDKAYLFREGLALVGKREQRDVWHPTGELDQGVTAFMRTVPLMSMCGTSSTLRATRRP